MPGRCAKSNEQEGICQSDVQSAMCQSNVQRVGNIVPEEECPRKNMPVSRKAGHPLCKGAPMLRNMLVVRYKLAFLFKQLYLRSMLMCKA